MALEISRMEDIEDLYDTVEQEKLKTLLKEIRESAIKKCTEPPETRKPGKRGVRHPI